MNSHRLCRLCVLEICKNKIHFKKILELIKKSVSDQGVVFLRRKGASNRVTASERHITERKRTTNRPIKVYIKGCQIKVRVKMRCLGCTLFTLYAQCFSFENERDIFTDIESDMIIEDAKRGVTRMDYLKRLHKEVNVNTRGRKIVFMKLCNHLNISKQEWSDLCGFIHQKEAQ